MPTIKEVARRAGVSTTTVSHVINNTRFVGPELRERVMQAMAELNYRPNSLARSLRLGRTKTIGLILPDNSNPFFAEMARAIEDTGYAHGYSVILCNSDGSIEKQRCYTEALVDKQVDGIVLIAAGDSAQDLNQLAAIGMPTVVLDRAAPEMIADGVSVDNELGGYIATQHLIKLGHRRIACVAGPSELSPSGPRVLGYRRALAEAGLDCPPAYVETGDFRAVGGAAATGRLLSLPQPPTAVFVSNDVMAIGALRAARIAGFAVPHDLSIVGFDDIYLAAELQPALTTVAQPIEELGRRATELLIERTSQPQPISVPRWILLSPELVIRSSTAACKQENEEQACLNV